MGIGKGLQRSDVTLVPETGVIKGQNTFRESDHTKSKVKKVKKTEKTNIKVTGFVRMGLIEEGHVLDPLQTLINGG